MPGDLFNFEMEFRLGIREIDEEHACLVNMINTVHNLISSGSKEEARRYFKETLANYVDEHFTHEEAYMERIGFPQVEEHRLIHARFKQTMQEILPKIDSLDESAFRAALTDTYTWIIQHIGKTDRRYVSYQRP
ncbi:bacteriohemerythrin [Leptolinea tardivitalis]|uniref:Hemerythrin-like domain-containing protein n=1 Tax=Leptolinea tardivitalis TaxID=229920 RepID=A0A0N8GKU0_9CHLR|nr:hemerythrin family protein [Leptolinea tardivitalis]KPL70634.1 hypothetical protein ADM99_16170 [Leptolinea tardivitalis]GAP22257.1 protein containing hemerythrin-like metal-binding domain [Leptolinea tardivitalis]